jgi:hypothetical protein
MSIWFSNKDKKKNGEMAYCGEKNNEITIGKKQRNR